MKIGLFDSGIGGLTVLAHLKRLLPDEEYLYYADTDNVPYGTKSTEKIYEYSRQATEFLRKQGAEIICIACNTATSVAANRLREEYDLPIIGIEPAVKPAVNSIEDDKRILVLATPVTVREKKLKDLIDRVDLEHQVDMLSLEKLPMFAENGDFDSDILKTYLKESFSNFDTSKYSRVVLGCTHFIHFVDAIRLYFDNDVVFLDGSEGTARNIKRCVSNLKSSGEYRVSFYKSGRPVVDEKTLDFYNMILQRLEKTVANAV